MKRSALLVATVCLTACQTPTTPPSDATSEPAVADSAKPAAALAPASELSREDAQKRVCAAVKGDCTLTDLKPAGDAKKQFYVAEAAFIKDPAANGSWKFPNHDLPDGCNAWALFAVDGSTSAAPKEIERFCNDGHGASGMGEDSWEVSDGRLSIRTNGGSNWRWSSSKVIDLPTNTIVEEGSSDYFGSNPSAFHEKSRVFDKMLFSDVRSAWPCGADEDTAEEFKSLSIPRVALPAGFASNWKAVGLGECATRIDATGDGGFVIHGQKSTAADTSMKVVASGQDIYVEVNDDLLIPSETGKWIHGDHLELWVSTEDPLEIQAECVDLKTKTKTWQWGMDANTAEIHDAYGKPATKLVAEREAIPGGVRFKVTLPADTKAVTVIYSDSDDGKSQERLVATSSFKFANAHTMGVITEIDSKFLECAVKDGQLVKTLKPFVATNLP